MPVLFLRTGSLGEPSLKDSTASRYILRAMKISPRISGERGVFGGARAGGGTLVPSSRALLVCEKASVALRAVTKALVAKTTETGRKSMVASFVYLSTTFNQAHALKHTSFKHATEATQDAFLSLLRSL